MRNPVSVMEIHDDMLVQDYETMLDITSDFMLKKIQEIGSPQTSPISHSYLSEV
jgi:hypothetical protein